MQFFQLLGYPTFRLMFTFLNLGNYKPKLPSKSKIHIQLLNWLQRKVSTYLSSCELLSNINFQDKATNNVL